MLDKVIFTPPGSPIADALSVLLQVVLKVYTVSIIAVVAVTVCDCGPEVSALDIVHEIAVVDAVVELAVVADTAGVAT